MSSKSSGSTIRLIVLLAILGLVGFSWYNDTNNLKPKVDQLTDTIWNMDDPVDGPYQSERVQKEIGFKPARTFKVDEFTVEEYKMSRTIPFLSFYSMYLVYDKNGDLFKISQGEIPTKQSIAGTSLEAKAEFKKPVMDRPAMMAGGGGPPPSKEEKKEEAKAEDKQEQPPAAEQPATGDKKDGEETKEGDGG